MMTLSVYAQVEYQKADSIKVEQLLRKAKAERGNENRMYRFGMQLLGVPYVAHTLENGSKEHLIVNLRELDCTTFVETVAALSLCDKKGQTTFRDFCRNLTSIRYRDGKMTDYTSRLHYFTWWGEDNEKLGIVKCVSNEGAEFTGVQTVNISFMTDHPDLYKQLKNHPNFVPVIKKLELATNGKKYKYLPKSKLGASKEELSHIHTGDIVSLLTKKPGLDTTHIGIAVWKGGKLHLLNASSLQHKVVLDNDTFYNYGQRQKSMTGIRVYRLM